MISIYKYILLLIWCLMMPYILSAQILENYNPSLRIYHTSDLYYSPERAGVDINVSDFPSSEIRLQIPGDAAVFLDNVMWFHAENDTVVQVLTSYLKEGEEGGGIRKLIILKKDVQLDDISILKGYFNSENIIEVAEVEESEIVIKREKEVMKEFFYLALIIILFLVALFKIIYPLLFSLLLKPISMISAEDFSDNVSRPRIFSSDVIFYLVIFSMLIMLLVVSAVYYMDLPVLRNFLKNELNFMFLIWLVGTMLLLMLSIAKLFWLKISTAIYGLGRLEFIHFFYMLRIISFSLMTIFLIFTVILSNNLIEPQVTMPYLLTVFFILYICGIAMLFFLMTKKVSFKNYHLFSYLCTAELVPFLVIAKLIIG